MTAKNTVKREDLIGRTGSITREIKIIDAEESVIGGAKSVNIRVEDKAGNVYWTTMEDENIALD